jgi:hypothetical protein
LAGKNALGIEMEVAWANPGTFTVNNFACYEDGSNCVKSAEYQDPSVNLESLKRRLAADKKQAPGSIRG